MCGIFGALLKKTEKKTGKKINKTFYDEFQRIKHRGPNNSKFFALNNLGIELGFQRLSINDLTSAGDQPFEYECKERTIYVMCNGEIYNHKEIEKKYDLHTESKSDCEVILKMFKKFGEKSIEMMSKEFNSEHAFAVFDINTNTNDYSLYLSNDRFGIRPLFIGTNSDGFFFASELKALPQNCNIKRFKPRNYGKITKTNGELGQLKYTEYYNLNDIKTSIYDYETAFPKIVDSLTNAVKIRLESDQPIGCLLSGGVDSSLICALAQKELSKQNKKLQTFSIGMPNSSDKEYAIMVAEHIGSVHTHVELDESVFLKAIPEVIQTIESFDITTVRASVAQYLIGKWISENTDIKVLGVGEMSDELNGSYLYFKNAPSEDAFQNECIRLMNDIHFFDVIRCDRCISRHGIEVRVPFADVNYINETLSCATKLRLPQNGVEKFMLRKAFEKTNLLPKEVLWREKCAQSDGISSSKRSWYEIIQDNIKDDDYNPSEYSYLQPISKEAYFYRKLFCEFYGDNNSTVIPYFWLPKWCGNVTNPSARVLDVCLEMK